MTQAVLPTEKGRRKEIPLVRGLLDYFPAALAAVAEVSRVGNEQHNPGEEMHWARGKSSDHADCIVRHLVDRGTLDNDKLPHSAKVAWRALALLQEELEAQGAPAGRASRFGEVVDWPALKTTPPVDSSDVNICKHCGHHYSMHGTYAGCETFIENSWGQSICSCGEFVGEE